MNNNKRNNAKKGNYRPSGKNYKYIIARYYSGGTVYFDGSSWNWDERYAKKFFDVPSVRATMFSLRELYDGKINYMKVL